MNYAKLTIRTPTHQVELSEIFDPVAVNQIQQRIDAVLRGNQSFLRLNFTSGHSVLLPAEVVRGSLFVFQSVQIALPQPEDPHSPTPP